MTYSAPGPSSWQPPQQVVVPPPSLKRSIRCMYAGAVVGVIASIANGLSGYAYYNTYETSPSGVTTVHTHSWMAGIVTAIITAALWCWMAWKNRQGRSWARVLSTVFFGFMCLQVLGGLLLVASKPWVTVTSILEWAVGLAALLYLWRAESSQYFAAPPLRGGYAPVPPRFGPGQPSPPPPPPGEQID